MRTSQRCAMRGNKSAPAAVRMSAHTWRFPAFISAYRAPMPLTIGGTVRQRSPPGDSIFITSAPRSAKTRPLAGPAMICDRSRTRTPSRGRGNGISPTIGLGGVGSHADPPLGSSRIDPLLLADLADEQASLDRLLAPTPCRSSGFDPPRLRGWTIADQVWHLAVSERAAALAGGGTEQRGLWRPGPGTDHARHRAGGPPGRVAHRPGGHAGRAHPTRRPGPRDLGSWPLSARSLAEARLMETWAHGLDCFAALDVEPVTPIGCGGARDSACRPSPTPSVSHGDQPPGESSHRARPRGPGRNTMAVRAAASVDVISGAAGEWCRVVTRRRRAEDTSLRASSPLGRAGPHGRPGLPRRLSEQPRDRSPPRTRQEPIRTPGSAAHATSARSEGSRTSRGSAGPPRSRSGHRAERSSPSSSR